MGMWKVTVFSSNFCVGLLDPNAIIPEYLKLCIDYDNSISNTKYTIEKIHKMNGERIQRQKFAMEFEQAAQLADVW